jgi:DNA-damage-inducible protein D
MDISLILKELDGVRHETKKGVEYWRARDIQPILGYDNWQNFVGVIERAIEASKSAEVEVHHHFTKTSKMIKLPKGAHRQVDDYFLTRGACYLVAMNGDAKKPEIGAAQTYFAVQTRRQELQHQNSFSSTEIRLQLREQIKTHIIDLNSTAKKAGVQRYALFHDAGYRGLYQLGLNAIKQKKRIGRKEQLFDRAGSAELAANFFRITQADEKLRRDQVNTEQEAIDTHFQVGQEVRTTITKIGGRMPEDLPAEEPIKQVEARIKKQLPKPENLDD